MDVWITNVRHETRKIQECMKKINVKEEGKNRQENNSEGTDIKTTEKIRERKDCQFVRNSRLSI